MGMAAGTIEDPNIQGHLLPVSTGATCLTRIGRIDFGEGSASFFRFARELGKECRPRGICNAFGKTVVVNHAVHLEVFYTDDPIGIDNLTTILMGEVLSSEANPLMDAGNNLAMLASLGSTLGKFGVLTLDLGKGLFFLAKEARVLYLSAIGESGKGFQPDINTYLGGRGLQALWLTFNREADVPLASRGTMNCTGLHLAFDGPMVDHFETSNLGEADSLIVGDTKSTLRKGETIISSPALKAWEAWVLRMLFAAAEEGFEGQINTYRNILQDLGMDCIQGRAFLFQDRKGGLLPVEGETLARMLVGLLTLFEQVVIEPTALFQGLVELGFLLL